MSLLRSIATIGAFTSISRVLGFIRDVLIAALLGAGPIADAFFVALRFPNLFRALFAEGAFSAAFVPIFVKTLETEGREQAKRFADEAFSMLTYALFVFVVVAEVAMPVAMLAMAPGFAGTPTFDYVVEFSRITFPYLLFISLTALTGGVLNALGRFAAPAATPILLNLSLIGALVGVGPLMPTLGHALSWGVLVAGFIQCAWLHVNTGTAGMWLRLLRPQLTTRVRQLLRRAVPVAFGAGIYQVNILVDTIVASLLPVGSVSYLFYADRLSQLPHGIIGAAVSTALLPILSRQLSNQQVEAAMHSQNRALEFALLLMLPAAVALVVLAEPFISVLFQRGAFGPTAVHATAQALAAYAIGLPGILLIKSLTPGFYARQDTRTPVKIAAVSAIVHVALSFGLMVPFKHVGIALSTSISAWLNAWLLGIVLYRRGFLVFDERFRHRVPRTALSAVVMAGALYFLHGAVMPWLAGSFTFRVLAVLVLVTVGLAAFTLSALVTGAATWSDFSRVLKRKRG